MMNKFKKFLATKLGLLAILVTPWFVGVPVGVGIGAMEAQAQFLAPMWNPQPLYINLAQSTIVPQRAGNTAGYTPTFTRATARSCMDFEPKITYPISGETCMWGARRVYNLIAGSSENLTNGNYVKDAGGTGSAPTVTAAYAAGPLPGMTASRVQFNKGAGTAGTDYSRVYAVPGTGGYTNHSGYFKSNTGDTYTLAFFANGTQNLFTITPEWQRFNFASPSGNSYWMLQTTGNNATSQEADVLITGAQQEVSRGQANVNPGDYVSVGVLSAPYHGANVDGVKYFTTQNGNIVSSTGVVTDATGPPISSIYLKYGVGTGVDGSYFSVPDAAAQRPTGDMEYVFRVVAADWTPTADQQLILSGNDNTAANINYQLTLKTAGTLNFRRPTGATDRNYLSSAATAIPDGTAKYIKVTWDQDNGASASEVRFYLSDNGTTWTQLGTAVTNANTGAGNSNTTGLKVGSLNSGLQAFNGRIYSAQIYNGIDGTLAVNFNANDYRSGSTWVAGTTGETWTVNGSASVFTGAGYYDNAGPYGYLAEGARTNYVLQSQALENNSYWQTAGNVTVTANTTVAPDGTTTADTITEAATTATHRLSANNNVGFASAVSTPYTISVFSKKGTRDWHALWFTNNTGTSQAQAWFNVSTGAVGTVTTTGSDWSGATARLIQALPNGWYRWSLTATTSGDFAGNVFAFLAMADADGVPSYTGDAAQTSIMWGAMVEAGAFASTYIPTTTVAVARNADVLYLPAAGNIQDAQGSCIAELRLYSGIQDAYVVSTATNILFGAPISFSVTNVRFLDSAGFKNFGSPPAVNSLSRLATRWGDFGSNAFKDGTQLGGTGTYSGLLVRSPFISIGMDNTTNQTSQPYASIRNIRIMPAANDPSWLRQATSAR
jgi:hypothetical protein